MPSAWPRSSGPSFCSTMQVLMSGNAEGCAASVKPAGPQPTIRISTSSGTGPADPDAAVRCAGSAISGSPGSNPFRWNCTTPPASEPSVRPRFEAEETVYLKRCRLEWPDLEHKDDPEQRERYRRAVRCRTEPPHNENKHGRGNKP